MLLLQYPLLLPILQLLLHNLLQLQDSKLSYDLLLNQSDDSVGRQNVTFLYNTTFLKINREISKNATNKHMQLNLFNNR